MIRLLESRPGDGTSAAEFGKREEPSPANLIYAAISYSWGVGSVLVATRLSQEVSAQTSGQKTCTILDEESIPHQTECGMLRYLKMDRAFAPYSQLSTSIFTCTWTTFACCFLYLASRSNHYRNRNIIRTCFLLLAVTLGLCSPFERVHLRQMIYTYMPIAILTADVCSLLYARTFTKPSHVGTSKQYQVDYKSSYETRSTPVSSEK